MAFLDETGATILADEVKTYVGNTAVAKEAGKGLSTNDYTTDEKNKLDGIAEGANKTIVDSALNASSENPVQNKVIYTEFEKKLNTDGDSKDLTNTFVSQDSTNVTQWTDVDVLASAEKHSSVFNKISTMFKNIRYLYKMLGTADISTLGDGADIGTVTGALSKLNSDFNKINILPSNGVYYNANTDRNSVDARCKAIIDVMNLYDNNTCHRKMFCIPIRYKDGYYKTYLFIPNDGVDLIVLELSTDVLRIYRYSNNSVVQCKEL